ncbi:MAG: hypothetical protein PHW14_03835 [Candidatus Omnitrophica bacterium]|nr:hypothetical protein [Candidatus Omnitrophota bacterium]
MQDTRYKMQDARYKIQDARCRILDKRLEGNNTPRKISGIRDLASNCWNKETI